MAIATDRERAPDEDNPKGYFELERIKQLDKGGDKAWLKSLRGKAVKIISYLLRDLPPENDYRVILMNRDLAEVVASQNKMLGRRAGSDSQSEDDSRVMARFEEHLRLVKTMLDRDPWFEWIEVNHRAILADPAGEARRVAAFLGGKLHVERMAAAVDPDLYRNRAE